MLLSTPHMRTGSITNIMNSSLHKIAFILIAHTTTRIAGQLMASEAEACGSITYQHKAHAPVLATTTYDAQPYVQQAPFSIQPMADTELTTVSPPVAMALDTAVTGPVVVVGAGAAVPSGHPHTL